MVAHELYDLFPVVFFVMSVIVHERNLIENLTQRSKGAKFENFFAPSRICVKYYPNKKKFNLLPPPQPFSFSVAQEQKVLLIVYPQFFLLVPVAAVFL